MIFRSRALPSAVVAGLLVALGLQLGLSVTHLSQTWDQACDIDAGYPYGKTSDFGINPEHPPLVTLLANVPVLRLPRHLSKLHQRYFMVEEFLGGRDFVYQNDADLILLRSRIAASTLPLLLGLLLFLAERDMFGVGRGLRALA